MGARSLVADGASQAGILLGSNENIPAFRWIEKETATDDRPAPSRMTAPRSKRPDRWAIRPPRDGGASRGNLLSGGADQVILTVSRIEAEKKANPGYRAFFANGFNVTRVLVLFVLGGRSRMAGGAPGALRRDVHPRGHRGGTIRSSARRCASSSVT